MLTNLDPRPRRALKGLQVKKLRTSARPGAPRSPYCVFSLAQGSELPTYRRYITLYRALEIRIGPPAIFKAKHGGGID
jgi:hypothetical protein